MRLGKVDLNLFVVFDALYQERSVTKVAVLLSLTQPAVSNALARLRETFNDQLFVRTPDGMAPTPVADSIVGDVRQALFLLGESVGVNARFDPSAAERVFRVAMNDLAESLLLPHIYIESMNVAPKVSILSYYVDRVSATEELKSGAADLLLDISTVNAKEFVSMPLSNLPYVCAMRKGHPLLAGEMTMEDYLSAKHIHVSSRRKGRGQVDIAIHKLGSKRSIAMRVKVYLVAARIAEQTDLLWTVPEILAKTLPLETMSLPFDVEPLEWSLYWHKSVDTDPANKWLREVFASVVNKATRGYNIDPMNE